MKATSQFPPFAFAAVDAQFALAHFAFAPSERGGAFICPLKTPWKYGQTNAVGACIPWKASCVYHCTVYNDRNAKVSHFHTSRTTNKFMVSHAKAAAVTEARDGNMRGWKTTAFFFHNFSLSPFASQLHFSLLKIFLRWKRRGGTNHPSYNLLRSMEEWKSSPSPLKKFILHWGKPLYETITSFGAYNFPIPPSSSHHHQARPPIIATRRPLFEGNCGERPNWQVGRAEGENLFPSCPPSSLGKSPPFFSGGLTCGRPKVEKVERIDIL